VAPPVLTEERREHEANLLDEAGLMDDEPSLMMNPVMLVVVLLVLLLGVWGLIWGPLAAL
jgi:hypothetical protein